MPSRQSEARSRPESQVRGPGREEAPGLTRLGRGWPREGEHQEGSL